MFMISLDLTRITHRDRHHRLVADADARRLRRQLEAERNAARPPGRAPRPIGAWLDRRRSRRDGKIERLRASWLQPSRRDATRLAQLADLIDVEAGTVLAPGRFAYIGFDEQHAGLVVADGTATVALTSRAELLVLGAAAFEEMRRSIKTIGDAWTRATGHGREARTTGVPIEAAASPDAPFADRQPGTGARVADGRPIGRVPAGAPRIDEAICAGR